MPTPKRIEYPGAFYHVINRGRNKENIFHNEYDFRLFLKIIEKTCKKFDAVIHAYCLMSNHYHLLIETPKGNLQNIMHNIGTMYVQKYNFFRACDGSLFKGRYKAIIIDSESYLLELNRYIHNNPKLLVKKLEDYKWSSYPAYIKSAKAPFWLNTELTLSMISYNQREYIDFIKYETKHNHEIYGNRKTLPSILGNADFKRKILNNLKTPQGSFRQNYPGVFLNLKHNCTAFKR